MSPLVALRAPHPPPASVYGEQSPRASGPVRTAQSLTLLDVPFLLRSSKAGHGASPEQESSQQGPATSIRGACACPVSRQSTPCKPGGVWLVDGSWQVTKEMPLLRWLTGPKAPGHTAFPRPPMALLWVWLFPWGLWKRGGPETRPGHRTLAVCAAVALLFQWPLGAGRTTRGIPLAETSLGWGLGPEQTLQPCPSSSYPSRVRKASMDPQPRAGPRAVT